MAGYRTSSLETSAFIVASHQSDKNVMLCGATGTKAFCSSGLKSEKMLHTQD